jgi:cytochrome c biogenesis factor
MNEITTLPILRSTTTVSYEKPKKAYYYTTVVSYYTTTYYPYVPNLLHWNKIIVSVFWFGCFGPAVISVYVMDVKLILLLLVAEFKLLQIKFCLLTHLYVVALVASLLWYILTSSLPSPFDMQAPTPGSLIGSIVGFCFRWATLWPTLEATDKNEIVECYYRLELISP